MDPASGSDEGEIIESESEKATTSLPSVNGVNVDRPSRNRLPASKPTDEREDSFPSRDRSPSPRDDFPRGEKRLRDDDHYYDHHPHSDSRRVRPHYEDRYHDERRRSHVPYADLDYGESSNPYLRYDDRGVDDRSRDKRPRTRSRSPGRSDRTDSRSTRWEREGRRNARPYKGRSDQDYRRSRKSSTEIGARRTVPPTSSRRQGGAQSKGLDQHRTSSKEDESEQRYWFSNVANEVMLTRSKDRRSIYQTGRCGRSPELKGSRAGGRSHLNRRAP